MSRCTALWLFALLLATACDDTPGGTDAGADADTRPAILLSVDTIERVETITTRSGSGLAPSFTDRFEVASVTLTAVREGPLPVAPIAFQLTLTDDTTINAHTSATNQIVDGCDSRSVPVGEATTCVVVFGVDSTAPDARSITWSNGGSLSTVARVGL